MAKLEEEARRELDTCIGKIRALSKEEVVKFVQEHSKKYRRVVVDTSDNQMNPNMY